MDFEFRPIVLPEPKRLRLVRWVWLALVAYPLYYLLRNSALMIVLVLAAVAIGAWIWLGITDPKPPYGLLFNEEGQLAVALSEAQMASFKDAQTARLVGSQFFEHWIALQIWVDYPTGKRRKLSLLLSGSDAWNDDDWHALRVRLLHLKNPQAAA